MADYSVKDEFLPQRWKQFHYYATGSAVLSSIDHDASFSTIFKLTEVRLHFSTAMGSVKYFNIGISSLKGSAYNTILLSQSLNGVQDLFLHYSEPLMFASDDILRVYASVLSVANAYGLEIVGWAVTG